MACSTCGATVLEGRRECATCGAAAPHPAAASRAVGVQDPRAARPVPHGAAVCPRCAYGGEGVGYFSQGSHIAILLLLGVAFLPFAIAYFAFRYGHRVCPRCGLDWGKYPAERDPGIPTQLRGGGTPIGAILLAILAAVLLAVGIGEAEAAPALLGAAAGGGAWLRYRAAADAREERRAALLASLAQPVLRLAAERQGLLTVTEVAAQLGWTLKRAEKVLDSMEDGVRVCSEVTDEGVIVYEFRELVHAPSRLR